MNDREFIIGSIVFTVGFITYWLFGHPYFIAERIVMFIAIVGFGGTLIFYTRKAQ